MIPALSNYSGIDNLTSPATLIAAVRAATANKEMPVAERLISEYREKHGTSPELIEANSWLARGALAEGLYAQAAEYAKQTRRLVTRRLRDVGIDEQPRLAVAMGAAIEVFAQSLARQNRQSEAVRFLRRELAKYEGASFRTRIRKNLNLLTLEGQTAPELEIRKWLGPKPVALSKLSGRPVILFFWAHYCTDSQAQARALVRIRREFQAHGAALIAPTRRYGYLDEDRQQKATSRQEMEHIQQTWDEHYSELREIPVPLSERDFDVYGVSTTPTLVVINRAGIVSLYHPGRIPYQELAADLRRVLHT